MRSGGGGEGGGRPSPAGLFVPTCTCRKSGGMTQTGYPTLSTMIYTKTLPEPNTILPGSFSVVGADGSEGKDKERKAAKETDARMNSKVMP